ncbi:hypothetical protein N7527_000876 [Penicillium freii]|nr:hypothetical protein N7527_000876 [Penicillium freii]
MIPFRTSLVQPPRDAGPVMRNPPARNDPRARANDHNRWVPPYRWSPRAGIGEAFPSLSSASNVDLQVGYYRIHVSKVSFLFSASSHTRELSYVWSSGERSGSEI